ncbi:hypothetical protein Y032_0087g2079 [Ancylostoma ceylanicum]|uniref:Uncharacterized protein n=1 Tax=Ancylostoma ceylanicum TaxID=53326 RepID=A0A016TQ68_9BILA|nr:hypothetical protein Y032_0087g2079 [Ancylostoma ceylanicum]
MLTPAEAASPWSEAPRSEAPRTVSPWPEAPWSIAPRSSPSPLAFDSLPSEIQKKIWSQLKSGAHLTHLLRDDRIPHHMLKDRERIRTRGRPVQGRAEIEQLAFLFLKL